MLPFFIGNHEISPSLILAPMSGVSNTCFRQLIKRCNPGSVGLVVSEFISVEALVRGVEKSYQMMEYQPFERPFSVQIFGHNIGNIVTSAKIVEDKGVDILDINCGCPVPKVVKKGGGCELMRQPLHLAKILRFTKRAISIPLTLKIRSGWDINSRNALEIAKIAENEGVSMLTIHGRTRTEAYRGRADWQLIAEVADSLKIPVVGSGDVICGHTAHRALESGIAGIMIGRGAMRNPWVFRRIKKELKGETWEHPGPLPLVELLDLYSDMLYNHFGPRKTLGLLKQISSQATRCINSSGELRKSLCRSKTFEEFSEILKTWKNSLLYTREVISKTTSRLPI